jgi:hypothetical protein
VDVQNLPEEVLLDLAHRADVEAALAKAKSDEFKAEIRRRYDGHKTILRKSHDGNDPGFEVKLTYPRRFDPELAMELLTDRELAKIMVTKPDSKLAKQHLSPEDYREVTYADTTRVSFKTL